MRRLLLGLLLSALPCAANAQQTICVDPGHGGADPGAVGCGYEEEDIVLDVSTRLRDRLQAAGFRVVMTRTNDSAVGLTTRASRANSEGAARFMSIHANSAASVATGIETFCSPNGSSNSFDLRDEIQAEMVATWPLRSRGGKTANFTVLTATNMPATLSELGFINNCNVDVRYLSDPAERQRAAQAHVTALQRHLGISTNPTTGTLTGVIFEDQGQGLDDTSVRLANARITIQETSDAAMSSASTGAWQFELAPGAYTVRAELDGYGVTARTCEVRVSDTTWCSIGLFSDDVPRDGGVATPDAGSVDPVDAGQVDAGTNPRDAGVVAPDAGSARVRDGGEPVLLEALDAEGGCGCTATERTSSGGFAFFAVLALALLGRRKSVSLLILLALAGTARAEEPLRIEDEKVLVEGFTAPIVAPDGRSVLVTDRAKHRLVLVDVEERSTRVVLERPGAGYLPEWSSDSRAFGVRSAARPFSGEPLMQFDLLGTYQGPQVPPLPLRQVDGRVLLDGRPLHDADAPSFAPRTDPRGRFVAFETDTGLVLYRVADDARFALGRGSAPSFSADGRLLVFERTTDDGHELRTSGLFLVRLDADTPKVELLRDDAGLERTPSLSAARGDTYTITYAHDDRVMIGLVRVLDP